MKNLLIVGCGDVMRRVLPQLTKHWRVIALVRQRDEALARLGVVQICGDLDQGHTLRRLSGIADAVIHSVPPAPTGENDLRTRRLIACLRRGKSLPRALVYISTSGVYGDCAGALIDETQPCKPHSARAIRRLDAERQLRSFGQSRHQFGSRVSIVRVPGIYAANRLPLERLHKALPLIDRIEDSHTNHIHAEDLGRACIAALKHGRRNRAYNASDDTALLMGDWFDLLADKFALPRAPRLPRAEIATRVSEMQWSFMSESRRMLNVRMKRELGVRLRYPTVREGIA